MDPNKKIVNETRELVTETSTDEDIENHNIKEAIISSEPDMRDMTGLNMDTSFVNNVNDAEEPEN